MKNYYEILGVAIDAGEIEIRNAYRKLVRIYHPDVSSSDTKERMQEIIQAYAALSDLAKRKEYDGTLKITQHVKDEGDEKAVPRHDSKDLDRELLRKKRALLHVIEKRFSFFGLSIADFRSIFKDVMDKNEEELK